MAKAKTSDPLALALAALAAADDPLEAVQAAHVLRELAEEAELERICVAREQGVAWAKIGRLYGLTKQGAQQRFRQKKAAAPPEDPAQG